MLLHIPVIKKKRTTGIYYFQMQLFVILDAQQCCTTEN